MWHCLRKTTSIPIVIKRKMQYFKISLYWTAELQRTLWLPPVIGIWHHATSMLQIIFYASETTYTHCRIYLLNKHTPEKPLRPWCFIMFFAQTNTKFSVCSFSYASFIISSHQSYGQSGCISGIVFSMDTERRHKVYLLHLCCFKHQRVRHCSYFLEIL